MKMGFYGDTLLHRERTFELVDQPLEQYFELIGSRPELETAEADSREYTARWTIEDGWLYLVTMVARWNSDDELQVKDLFPFAGNKVFAAWYNGPIRAYRRDRSLPDLSSPETARYPDVTLEIQHGRVANSVLLHRPAAGAADQVVTPQQESAQVIELANYRRPAINAAFEEMML